MIVHKVFLPKAPQTPVQGPGGGAFVCGNGKQWSHRNYSEGRLSWRFDINCPECLALCPKQVTPWKRGPRGKYELSDLEVGSARLFKWPENKTGGHNWMRKLVSLSLSIRDQEFNLKRRFSSQATKNGILVKRLS